MNAAEFTLEALETPALTKVHLADLLFEQIGLNKRESKDMVEAFFELRRQQPHRRHRRQDLGLRQLPDPREGAAAGPQPAHRRGHSDRRAPRRATFHASAKLKEQIQGSIDQNGASEVEWSLGAE